VRYLPLVILGLAAGLIADRMNRRMLMILCDLGRAAALGVVALLGALHQVPPLWLLASVVLVLGAGQLGFQVAYRAWLPDVTGDETLSRANAALEASDAASTLTGPPLGGVLIQALGASLALGSDALSYVVSALTLLGVRDEASPAETAGKTRAPHPSWRTLWKEMLQGMHFILTTPLQRVLKGMSTPLYLSSGAIELLLATLTQWRLHLPAWQAGLVFGAAGVGGLMGSAVAPRLYERGWRRSLAWTLSVAALACLGLAGAGALGATLGFVVALISNLILDGAVSLSFILTSTANALVTPHELRGRVNAASTMYSSLVRGLAVVVAGLLAAGGDPLPMFLLLTCGFVAAALLAIRRSKA
jgi:MFS family permease